MVAGILRNLSVAVLHVLFAALGASGCGSNSDAGELADGASLGGTGGTGGAGGAGGQPGTSGTQDPLAMPTCDDDVPGFGSCYATSTCTEAVSEDYAELDLAVCVPGLGASPSPEPCRKSEVRGRCFTPILGIWTVYYNYYGIDVGQIEEDCLASDGVWCINPAGISVAVAEGCSGACDAARPDFTYTPECAVVDDCVDCCLVLVIERGDGCVDCVTDGLTWAPGSCNDFECNCPPPVFASPGS